MSSDGTEYELLTEIQDRLREKVPFSESQCFLCDAPVPLMFPIKDPFCTISVGASQFDAEMWSGGGFNQLTQHTPTSFPSLPPSLSPFISPSLSLFIHISIHE